MMQIIKDDIKKLEHQFLCYQEGLNARFLDIRMDKNPYQPRSYMADAWEAGWDIVDYYLNSPLISKSTNKYLPIDSYNFHMENSDSCMFSKGKYD